MTLDEVIYALTAFRHSNPDLADRPVSVASFDDEDNYLAGEAPLVDILRADLEGGPGTILDGVLQGDAPPGVPPPHKENDSAQGTTEVGTDRTSVQPPGRTSGGKKVPQPRRRKGVQGK